MSNYKESPVAEWVAKLEARSERPALVPTGEWDAELTRALIAHEVKGLFGPCPVVDVGAAEAVRSGLLLWNDALDASHTVSQGIDTTTGSYWHGIMHRREPDYSNAKYWFRRVGQHAAMVEVRASVIARIESIAEPPDTLADLQRRLTATNVWDAELFVDCCEDAAGGAEPEVVAFLEQQQVEEIRILLAYSFDCATGQGVT